MENGIGVISADFPTSFAAVAETLAHDPQQPHRDRFVYPDENRGSSANRGGDGQSRFGRNRLASSSERSSQLDILLLQVRVAVMTVDVLKHLSSEEASRVAPGTSSDRMARLAGHILGQRR